MVTRAGSRQRPAGAAGEAERHSGGIAMNVLLVAMVVLIWFLTEHHSLLVHAP
jgi:hypothetical protein